MTQTPIQAREEQAVLKFVRQNGLRPSGTAYFISSAYSDQTLHEPSDRLVLASSHSR